MRRRLIAQDLALVPAAPLPAARNARPGKRRVQPGPPDLLTELEGSSSELWFGVHLPAAWVAHLELLAVRAQQFTPRVSIEPPDELLLEVRASLTLFGGLESLRAQVVRSLFDLAGTQVRGESAMPCIVAAPTPLAALVLARNGRSGVVDMTHLRGALTSLPLHLLHWPEQELNRLRSIGVLTIGEVLRLPRAGFARRFGTRMLAELDRLVGLKSEPRAAFVARERFRLRRETTHELSDQPSLLRAVRPLLDELESFLLARQQGVMALELRMEHRGGQHSRCRLRLAAPERAAVRLAHLFAEQLAHQPLQAQVRACELRSGALFEYLPENHSLWKPGQHGGGGRAQMPAFLERLRVRFGPESVYGLCLVPGHRPESTWRAQTPHTGQRNVVQPPWESGRRPLWLLREPRELIERDGVPRHAGRPLHLRSGPERLETGWWDGSDIRRDYYVAMAAGGACLWIFRERQAPRRWFLHGAFG